MTRTAMTARSNDTAGAGIPNWVSGWGRDDWGIFVQFSLPTGDKYWDYIDQRLRWIPAGTFLMGSPDSEAGRWPDEGPQHPVTISRGFWLMDTPVTQRLWQHVMGDNPSRFVDLDRPVERVDWPRCTEFCERLSQLVGASFQLPTEAQWEYACRAGTDTATYSGAMQILGERNAPILDDIAWYGGNSGVDFDLDAGVDSSDWPENQFNHQQAGTRKVSQKRPNPLGLYDMLGNVWEWCRDGMRTYSTQLEVDPGEQTDESAYRVIRGGSWYGRARYVRAAFRSASDPGRRDYGLGFRCVCVQSSSGASGLREVEGRD
jgi:formylglycine-generating enzyme required for sulfatase activity